VRASTVLRALALGGALAALAQLALPVGVPLYDGVPIVAPYRFLAPAPGQLGSPASYAADAAVSNGRSPQITAATGENPPQAQLIGLDGSFTVPPGVTVLHVVITPVAAVAPLPTGSISGNVYRIAVTAPTGADLPIAPGQGPTVALRGAAPLTNAAIFRYADGAWQQLDTVSNAALSIYTAEPKGLGDFAVVDLGAAAFTTTDIVIAGTVGIVIVAIAIWAIRAWRRRRALALESERSRRRGPRGPGPGGSSGRGLSSRGSSSRDPWASGSSASGSSATGSKRPGSSSRGPGKQRRQP
jgi:hypothetical protein